MKHRATMEFVIIAWIFLSAFTSNGVAQNVFDAEVSENIADVPLFNVTYIPDVNEGDCPEISDFTISQDAMSSSFEISPTYRRPIGNQGYSESTALVTLIKPLDYEKNTVVSLRPMTTCVLTGLDIILRLHRIQVINVFDSRPVFTNKVYSASIAEDQPVGTTILSGVYATDADISDIIDYSVQLDAKQTELFEAKFAFEDVAGIPRQQLQVVLKQPLDFENCTRHTFTVTVMDSVGMNDTCEVVIDVMDSQDMPPVFAAPVYTARICETDPLGTVVVEVSAFDGDLSTPRNAVSYSIIEGPKTLFDIDNTTGTVTISGNVDVDINGGSEIQNGLVLLVVEAKELNTSGEIQLDNTTSTVEVQVGITDANDNKPKFSAASYTGAIRVDAKGNEVISLEGEGFISVVDEDLMPSNNKISLHIEKDGVTWPVFEPSVRTAFAQASLLVVLKQPDALTAMVSTHVVFQIIATETTGSLRNRTSISADILLWVEPPSSVAEAVVDIPLRTSDFIIFVIGFLILGNIVLTFLLCLILRRQSNLYGGLFNRNKKYYVSKRDSKSSGAVIPPDKSQNDKHNDRNRVDIEGFANQTDRPITPSNKTLSGPLTDVIDENKIIINTVASAVNRSRCDVVPIHSHAENTVPKTSEEAVPREKGPIKRCDVIPLNTPRASLHSTSPNGDTRAENERNEQKTVDVSKCDVIPLESNKSLSSLLEKVQQKLSSVNNKHFSKNESEACDLRPITENNTSLESSFTDVSNSNNSSFSRKTKNDNIPLINKQGGVQNKDKKRMSTKIHDTAHVNKAFSQGEAITGTKGLNGDLANTTKMDSRHNGEIRDVHTTKLPVPDPPKVAKNSERSPPFHPPIPAFQTQIAQTGVPPIALALPFSTAVVPKEQSATVTNPVYSENTSPNDAETAKRGNGLQVSLAHQTTAAQPSINDSQKSKVKASQTQANEKSLDAKGNPHANNRNNPSPLQKPPRAPAPYMNLQDPNRLQDVGGNLRDGNNAILDGSLTKGMTQSEPNVNNVEKTSNQDFLTGNPHANNRNNPSPLQKPPRAPAPYMNLQDPDRLQDVGGNLRDGNNAILDGSLTKGMTQSEPNVNNVEKTSNQDFLTAAKKLLSTANSGMVPPGSQQEGENGTVTCKDSTQGGRLTQL